MAAKVKEAVNVPVLLGGRMGSSEMDEKAVAEGKISGVVLGRPSLADPDFPKKSMSILRISITRSLSILSDEYPLPKSSIRILNPCALS